MSNILQIVDQYNKLANWCDTWFSRFGGIYSAEMSCGKGCARCCTLTSVCALEAMMVAKAISDFAHKGAWSEQHDSAQCPLLCVNVCSIYAHRPIICRTHGLVMQHADELGVKHRHCCELNFPRTELLLLPETDVLDETMIAENLMRLNMAYCIVLSRPSDADKRYSLLNLIAQQGCKADDS